MLVEARDIDQAVELSKSCPILDSNGTVEIRSFVSIQEFVVREG